MIKIAIYSLFLGFCTHAVAIPTIQHWETTHGSRVYFVAAPELPMVDIKITFDAGSARDGNQYGLASLTNSLLEEGAGGKSADEIAEQFESVGANFSSSVDEDMASVSLRSLNEPALLQPVVELLALLLARPDFAKVPFERVRQQMLAGLKYEQQSPGTIADRAFQREIFGDHPYSVLSSGTPESVAALTRDEVQAFHQRYYVAKNAIVAIVGALDQKNAEKLANQIIEQLPVGEVPTKLPAVVPLKTANSKHIEHPSTQTHILVGQVGIARLDPDYFTLYVGNHLLGGSGLVSLLSKQVRENRGFAYSIYSYFFPRKAEGTFEINLQTRNDQVAEALKVVNTTLSDFIEKGVTDQELAEAKKNIIDGFPMKIDSNKEILGYLSVIGFYQLPLDYLQNFAKNIEAVTIEQIKETFKRRVHLDKLVTVTVGTRTSEKVSR